MREDLNKVLCEDSRLGGLDFHWYRQRMDDFVDHYEDFEDDMPHTGDSSRARVGIRSSKIYWNGRRRFNEHLNPLKGIINKNVGRPWNKVYSELCAVFDKRSVINQHIMDHLDDYVDTKHIVVKEGKLFEQSHYNYGSKYPDGLIPLNKSSIQWYVDPRDGILKENKARRKSIRTIRKQQAVEAKKAELDIKRVYADGTELTRASTGQWWLCKYQFYERIQDWVKRQAFNNATRQYEWIEEYIWTYPPVRNFSGDIVRQQKVCVLSKQINGRELKQYGVENRVVEDKDGNSSKFSNSKMKRLEKRLSNKK